MDLFSLPPVIFFQDDLQYYASFEYQVEDEDPILLAKFVDCVR